MNTDDREALARAMYEQSWAAQRGMVTWEAAPPHIRKLYAERADAALAWFTEHMAERDRQVAEQALRDAADALDAKSEAEDGLYAGDCTEFLRARADTLAPAPGERCWCGGPIGPREPGDARGLGCLDNIAHALAATPTDGRMQG